MQSLSFLQLAVHQHLHHLPSFHGLVNLRTLTLALLIELEEIPEFTSLTKLERINMPLVPRIETFPDMAPIRDLLGFVLSYRGRVCCNGFLDNKCDLNKKSCYLDPSWSDSPVTCLPTNRTERMVSDTTRHMFAKFNASVCSLTTTPTIKENQYASVADVSACNGTAFRQCLRSGNRTGICYSLRMMPIACTSDTFPIAMRKRQILENVGDKCDPEHEVWLGCPRA